MRLISLWTIVVFISLFFGQFVYGNMQWAPLTVCSVASDDDEDDGFPTDKKARVVNWCSLIVLFVFIYCISFSHPATVFQ